LSFVLINDYPVRFRQQPTALFEFTISVIAVRYGANRRVCVGVTGSSYVMKRERDITNGSVIKGREYCEKARNRRQRYC
jgi:hypothetical protein